MTRRDGAEVKTKHLILTFQRHTLPALVKAGYLNCRVRPYVPNPQRCFRCQRFGHGSRSCRGRETCAKCASYDHVADVCEGSVACANCKGPHPAYSRSCPLWRQEKEILTLRAKENLSYPEAKQRFSFISKGTYSDAVRRGPAPRTESRATQFSLEDLAGPSQAPKQPAGEQGAPGNAGSTQPPQSIQARPPADRQPRASSSSQDGERGRRSNSSEAARLVTEQQGPPAAPSTSKDGRTNVGGSRPSTSKPSSAGSGRGRKLVAQVSDQFCRNFRLMRPIAYELIDNFGASPMFPPATHGGLPAKTPEEHVLSFLWYAANRSCIRDAAGRFNVAESSLHRMMRRVVDFILSIGSQVVKFPSDLQQMAEDFQKMAQQFSGPYGAAAPKGQSEKFAWVRASSRLRGWLD
ncbi:hypothetical protein ISCGN_009815 [Ixodes scapularis]